MSTSEIDNCSVQVLDLDPRAKQMFLSIKRISLFDHTCFHYFNPDYFIYIVIRIEETKLVCAIARTYFFFFHIGVLK